MENITNNSEESFLLVKTVRHTVLFFLEATEIASVDFIFS